MFSLSYLFNKLLNKLGISPWKKQDQKEHNTIAVINKLHYTLSEKTYIQT